LPLQRLPSGVVPVGPEPPLDPWLPDCAPPPALPPWPSVEPPLAPPSSPGIGIGAGVPPPAPSLGNSDVDPPPESPPPEDPPPPEEPPPPDEPPPPEDPPPPDEPPPDDPPEEPPPLGALVGDSGREAELWVMQPASRLSAAAVAMAGNNNLDFMLVLPAGTAPARNR
jgi:hypothetical protein